MNVKDNLKEDCETTDDIIKDLRNGCVSLGSKSLYESAHILFLLFIFKRQKNLMHNTWMRNLNTFTFGVLDEKILNRKLKATIKNY